MAAQAGDGIARGRDPSTNPSGNTNFYYSTIRQSMQSCASLTTMTTLLICYAGYTIYKHQLFSDIVA